ncbi:MAG: hypothetical protein HY863_03795 [Chloroflexi bacterium]|nr:hypothetical protein [Chloroflexota bacterium]
MPNNGDAQNLNEVQPIKNNESYLEELGQRVPLPPPLQTLPSDDAIKGQTVPPPPPPKPERIEESGYRVPTPPPAQPAPPVEPPAPPPVPPTPPTPPPAPAKQDGSSD